MSDQLQTSTTIPGWTLHHRLHRSLEHAGIEPADMADYLGVHVNTVRNYLTGRTRPQRAVLMAWAMRCGVNYDWLVTGTVPQDPPAAPGRGASKKGRSQRKQGLWCTPAQRLSA